VDHQGGGGFQGRKGGGGRKTISWGTQTVPVPGKSPPRGKKGDTKRMCTAGVLGLTVLRVVLRRFSSSAQHPPFTVLKLFGDVRIRILTRCI